MKTNKIHREILRNKIIKVSRRFFLEQGYEKTSIRQIVKKVGLPTGSLYNFFQNKEELLLYSLKDALFEISSLTDSITEEYKEPLLRYALDIALGMTEIFKHKYLFNLYSAIYQNESVEKLVIGLKITKMKNLLKELNLHFNDDEIHSRILVVHGAIKALMMAKINKELSADFKDIYSLTIKVALSEFDIPKQKIDKIIKLTTEVIQSKSFSREIVEKLRL